MAEFVSRNNTMTLTVRPPRFEYHGNERVLVPGKVIRFEDGIYRTNDPEEIAFLRKHRWYGSSKLTEITQQDQITLGVKSSDGLVKLPCGYEDCKYVAEGKTEDEVIRKLNGHRTRMGHWAKDLPEIDVNDEDDEDEEE